MGIRKDIEIDGQMVAFKASAAIPRIYRLKFQRDYLKRASVTEKKNHRILICSPLRCLRTLLLSWKNMQTRPSRIHRRNGLIISIHSRFIRFFRSLLSFGG